jgi:hypothetical protein
MTPIKKPLYKITATLLNSWNYIYQSKPEYQKDAYDSFVKYLNRIKEPPNFFMKRGLEFEDACYNGEVPIISDIVNGGAFQVYAEKDIEVDGYYIRMLGYLDTLKEGTIYDIKRVNQYDLQKYFTSYQHHIYFELVPEANDFVYLIGAGSGDSVNVFFEEYSRSEMIDIKTVIHNFFQFLSEHDLINIYIQNWKIDEIIINNKEKKND